MGSDLLSGVISTLVEKATDSVLEEFGNMLGLGVEQDHQKLHWKLLTVQAVIATAEKYSVAEPALREWLHAVKTAAYEAEDVLDELKYEALQKAVESEVRSKKAKFSQPFHLSLCWFNFSKNEMGKKLKDVLEKIDVIIADISRFRFLETSGANSTVPRLRSHSHVNESTVIGRSEDLERIVSILILEQSRRENVEVLPIVGMGGLGKTTLAQLICGDEQVKNHFQLRLWVCVSDEFDVARIAKFIIDLAIGSDSKLPVENMELIQRRLREELLMKRFHLILDDVWNENRTKWEQLKLVVSCGSPGSMVIVTTRSKKAASVMGTRSAYVLQGLNEDHMWDKWNFVEMTLKLCCIE
ncbi:Disease resistance protein RGA2 [Rhynchospora pubera]|uniref:Disease resistance protein RGA2 n=1 Tax=Rhynchospora pubera TaxID=906938 RepID=A0AAV8GGJ8_9POAL|nr:Disease resistance protein RGA2 [Rhynchospora pubera]